VGEAVFLCPLIGLCPINSMGSLPGKGLLLFCSRIGWCPALARVQAWTRIRSRVRIRVLLLHSTICKTTATQQHQQSSQATQLWYFEALPSLHGVGWYWFPAFLHTLWSLMTYCHSSPSCHFTCVFYFGGLDGNLGGWVGGWHTKFGWARGKHGKAQPLRFCSERGKACHLVGHKYYVSRSIGNSWDIRLVSVLLYHKL
jgi:hypothetical protein